MIALAQEGRTRLWTGLLDRAVDALTGPRRHAAVLIALTGYSAIWFVYRLVSVLPRDIHFDMSELYAWSRMLALGYDKHPPLSAVVVRLWFTVFPVSDASFTLLVVLNIALTLYVVWLILEQWVDPMKSAFGVALLMVVPFYNFHALKYNANTVLLPVWAFTAYAFLRSFETRSAMWAILAGLAAGAAMLGKYWSIFLVAGFVLAALIDIRKRAFLMSAAPYLMVLAGAVVIAPHLQWLMGGHDEALGYATRRLTLDESPSVLPTLGYFGGLVGYAALPIALWALILRPNLRALRDIADPYDPQRTLVLLCFALPNVLPLLAAPWLGHSLTPLWALPGYSLLPLILLGSPWIEVNRRAVRLIVSIAAAFSLGALISSPLVALRIHMHTDARPGDYGAMLARDVSQRWLQLTSTPMRLICGCDGDDTAQAVAFNLKLPTQTLFGKQGLGARTQLLTQGGVIVAAADNEECRQQGEVVRVMRPGTQRFFATYQPTLFGVPGKSFSYTAYIVPPP